MVLQYGQVWQYLPDFLAGAFVALWIAAVAFAGGLLIGLAGAAVLTFGTSSSPCRRSESPSPPWPPC